MGSYQMTVACDQQALDAAMTRLAGKTMTAPEIGYLLGAPEGSEVWVDSDGRGKVLVDVLSPGREVSMSRALRDDGYDGAPIVWNEHFDVAVDSRGKGIGTRILVDEVQRCAEAGFKRLETAAVGDASDKMYNGYYAWARLGYDGKAMGPDGPTTVHDIMASPEGRSWWKANGKDFMGHFDLAPGSRSRQVLAGYAHEKGIA